MKVLKVVLVCAVVISIFSIKSLQAQAIIVRGNTITFTDKSKEVFESTQSKVVITPAGNEIRTASFMLPQGHELIPEKGTKSIIAVKMVIDEVIVRDRRVEIKKSGQFKIILHINGSGTSSPSGW